MASQDTEIGTSTRSKKRPRLQEHVEISTSSHLSVSELDRLRYAFNNAPKSKLIKTLKKAVSGSRTKLPSLSTVFNNETFPAAPEKLTKCARYGEEFDPNYNKKTCKTWHLDPIYVGKAYPRMKYIWRCDKCGKSWKTDFSCGDGGPPCFVGLHVVDLPDSGTDSDQ